MLVYNTINYLGVQSYTSSDVCYPIMPTKAPIVLPEHILEV